MISSTRSVVNVLRLRVPRMGETVALALALLCHAAYGAGAVKDEVTKRGLLQTSVDQGLVAKSIVRANAVLEGSGVRLAPGWPQREKSAISEANAVPVYPIKMRAGNDTSPAVVPSGCRCIFVDPEFLAAWVAFNSKGTGRLALDRGYFLTFVLLHEAGHIKDGTPGAAFENGVVTQLNIDPSKAKSNERRADEFAAEQLRRLSRSTPATSNSLEANFVVIEIGKLSWNMQAFRTLDEFGSFAVGKPSVYFDDGYTHPNLALRILRTNDLIQQTPQTRDLLQNFEEARTRGAEPRPVYQKKP
jgi:hypothetical protein